MSADAQHAPLRAACACEERFASGKERTKRKSWRPLLVLSAGLVHCGGSQSEPASGTLPESTIPGSWLGCGPVVGGNGSGSSSQKGGSGWGLRQWSPPDAPHAPTAAMQPHAAASTARRRTARELMRSDGAGAVPQKRWPIPPDYACRCDVVQPLLMTALSERRAPWHHSLGPDRPALTTGAM